MMAGIYGFPKGQKQVPGLLQVHGVGNTLTIMRCSQMRSEDMPLYRLPGLVGYLLLVIRLVQMKYNYFGRETKVIRNIN